MTSTNNSIRAIDKESVHRICSGQVVLDMATAVKELLENSLDAGSTSIAIKFKQNGLDNITVTDNGSGISDANLETLALKHYTSKLKSFNDLERVRSFGFRGEALSSLCALANLTVTTSTGQLPTGVLVEYTSDGTIKSRTPTPMTKGTVVKISNLFEGIPVRRSEFVKNIKREFSKCLTLIHAYALIATNVRINCLSQMDNKPPTTLIATSGNASIRQNIINVFGPKVMVDLVELDLLLVKGDKGDKGDTGDKGSSASDSTSHEDPENVADDNVENGDITLTGYISSPAFGKGRSSTDRQYIFINGRPCTLPKVIRAISEVYHSFNTNQHPFLVANLVLPTSYYDVNVSPDKRTIFLHDERALVEEIRTKLTELFEPSRSTFVVNEARQRVKKPGLASWLKSSPSVSQDLVSQDLSSKGLDMEGIERHSDDDQQGSVGRRMGKMPVGDVASSSSPSNGSCTSTTATGPKQTLLKSQVFPLHPSENLKRKAENDSNSDTENEPTSVKTTLGGTVASQKSVSRLTNPANADGNPGTNLDVLEGYDPLDDTSSQDGESSTDGEDGDMQALQQRSHRAHYIVLDSEVHHDGEREWVQVGFDMEQQRRSRTHQRKIIQDVLRSQRERAATRKGWAHNKQMKREQTASVAHDSDVESDVTKVDRDDDFDLVCPEGSRKSLRLRNQFLAGASFANTDDASAQRSLERVLSKESFTRMKVIGQFNKAFIIVRLDNYAQGVQPVKGLEGQENGLPSHLAAHDKNRKAHGRHRGALITSDVYVIDQHASDEKYRFETLRAKNILKTQPLVSPMKLHLTAKDEITVMDHREVLEKSGFNLDYDPDAPVSNRFKLKSVPMSEGFIFNVKDFEELVDRFSEEPAPSKSNEDDGSDQGTHDGQHTEHHHRPSENVIQCTRMTALLASRACRHAVMIGHALNHNQMKRIVRHMGEIEQPWNCPHKRPTIRHLHNVLEQQVQFGGDSFQDWNEVYYDDEELGLDTGFSKAERAAASNPIALKKPTQFRGSLWKQFMAFTS